MYDRDGKIKKNWYIIWVAVFALTLSNILYTNLLQHQTENKFCSVVSPIASAYRENGIPPPTTELGRLLKERYLQLEKDLHC